MEMSVLLKQKIFRRVFKKSWHIAAKDGKIFWYALSSPSSEKKNKLRMPTNARSLKAQVIPHGKSPIPQICQLSTLLATDSLSLFPSQLQKRSICNKENEAATCH